ncbi:MAG: Hsp20/alpha crystallin family protein [Bacilli bacterium]|nr:Hsp20/alpha crystallin family protein [Bacilli bacterium]
MMLVPRRNSFDLFDDFFDDGFFTKNTKNMMKTDIREKSDKYVLDIDLPGFEKENINLSLENGYLTISAKSENETEECDSEKYLHKERFYGECSRSFYVGDDVEEKDINAEFKNGILKIEVPKKELNNETKEKKQIEIK